MNMEIATNFNPLESRRAALQFGLRALLVWVVVCAIVFLAQRPIATGLLPPFKFMVGLLQQDFTVTLRMQDHGAGTLIEATPFLMRPIRLAGDLALRPFVSLPPLTVNVDHALVPMVLLVTGIASWPFSGRREAIARGVLAVACLAVLMLFATPVLIVGMQQIAFLEAAQQHGAAVHETPLVTLMIFMESGGQWLLPLALAFASLIASNWMFAKRGNGPPRDCVSATSGTVDLAFPPV